MDNNESQTTLSRRDNSPSESRTTNMYKMEQFGEKTYGPRQFVSVNFLCGWGAAAVETLSVYPVSKVIFRQQLHGVLLKEAYRQLHSDGMRYLYRGLLPPFIQKTSCRALMFGMYEEYQHFLCGPQATMAGRFTLCHAHAAFLAGATEAVMCPLERIQVLLQTSEYHCRFANTADAFRRLWPAYGFSEYYRGLTTIILRNGLSNVLFFALRGPLKVKLLDYSNLDASAEEGQPGGLRLVLAEFGSGALLGGLVSTLFYPLNVVKTRIQSQLGVPFEHMFSVGRTVWVERNRSVRQLLRGVHVNFSRSILTWGITNCVFELMIRQFGNGNGR